MFYERLIALNRERHATLKMAVTPDHYRFAARTNAVPIMSTEFAEAARDYPIVFVGEEGNTFNVAALVGMRDQENLIVGSDGQWVKGVYVRAFARRYPFLLAKTDNSDNLMVCIGEVFPDQPVQTGQSHQYTLASAVLGFLFRQIPMKTRCGRRPPTYCS